MKKFIFITKLLFLLFLLFSCTNPLNPIDNTYCPKNQFNTKWACDNPSIYFTVIPFEKEGVEYADICGEINIENNSISITVFFTHFGRMSVYLNKPANDINNDDLLFDGWCRYTYDKLFVDIIPNSNNILPKDIEKLVFVRSDL